MSELYQRKITKARQSIKESNSVRSIVKSLRENSLKHQLTMNTKIHKGKIKFKYYNEYPKYQITVI